MLDRHDSKLHDPVQVVTGNCAFQNVGNVTDPASSLAEVNGVALIFWDIFEAKYGSGTGAVFLLLIPLGCGVFCGLHSITSASRYLFEKLYVWQFCHFGWQIFMFSECVPYSNGHDSHETNDCCTVCHMPDCTHQGQLFTCTTCHFGSLARCSPSEPLVKALASVNQVDRIGSR